MIKSNNYISNLHCEFDLKGFPASSDPLLAVQTPALLPMEELLLRKEGSGKSLCRLSVRTCQALRANLPGSPCEPARATKHLWISLPSHAVLAVPPVSQRSKALTR
jgi:hypothetical protein